MFWTFSHPAAIRPRRWSPGEAIAHRNKRLAWASKRLSEAGRHDQLKHAVNRLRQREEDPELRELLEHAWSMADSYPQLRLAVAEYKKARSP